MAKHESGTVRVIPADWSHNYHEVVCSPNVDGDAYWQIARKSVVRIQEPGRHRA